MLKIEEGKCYKTRDGRKVGPIERVTPDDGFHSDWKWRTVQPCGPNFWSKEGLIGIEPDAPNDLIAEWTDGPVVTETVTKTRIVPGVYDGVVVMGTPRSFPNRVEIGLEGAVLSADELDAVAAILSALAKGLRDA